MTHKENLIGYLWRVKGNFLIVKKTDPIWYGHHIVNGEFHFLEAFPTSKWRKKVTELGYDHFGAPHD